MDNESESIVQEALDAARLGRTTIIVAHRLSTIRNVDLIFALDNGQVAEHGTHDQLMQLEGIYAALVNNQETSSGSAHESAVATVESIRHRAKSINQDVVETKKDDSKEADVKVKGPSLGRVMSLNKPEWYFILLGCVASTASGAVNPAFSILFSKVTSVFMKCDLEEQERDIIMYSLFFIGIGVVSLCSFFFQSFLFGLSGENMTKRLRARAFKIMLSQDIGWFDDKANNVGTLCTKLSVEAAAVQGATGVQLGNVFMNVANLGVGLVLAFFYGWSITLVIIGFLPFLVISGNIYFLNVYF